MLECMSFLLYFEPDQQPWILYDFGWHNRHFYASHGTLQMIKHCADGVLLKRCPFRFLKQGLNNCVGTDTANVEQHG